MPAWDELTAEQQQQVLLAVRTNAQLAGVTEPLSGPLTISGDGEQLEIPETAV